MTGLKNSKIMSYRELVVWKKAHEFAKKVVAICSSFPTTEEAKIIKNQLLRSATSISANIAEGYGAEGGRVFRNSLIIARREATETDYWLLLSYELNFINLEDYSLLESGYREIRAMLSMLIRKLTPD